MTAKFKSSYFTKTPKNPNGVWVYVYVVKGTKEEMLTYQRIKGENNVIDIPTGEVLFFSSDVAATPTAPARSGYVGATAVLITSKNSEGVERVFVDTSAARIGLAEAESLGVGAEYKAALGAALVAKKMANVGIVAPVSSNSPATAPVNEATAPVTEKVTAEPSEIE